MSRQIKTRVTGRWDLEDLEGQYRLANKLSSRKLYTEAEILHRQTWQAKKDSLGHENISTLKSQYRLAWTLDCLKRYKEAEILHRQTWQIRQCILGQEHLDTLKSQTDLAVTLSNLKRYVEAEILDRQTWEIRQRILGQEHPDTLAAQHDLAWTLYSLKRYEEAEILDRQTWEIRQRVLGQEHPDTLMSQYNLGVSLYPLKRYEEAEILDRQTWEIRQRVLGQEHPDTLMSQYNLGASLYPLKRYEEAEILVRQTWETRQRRLGDCSLETLESLLKLSINTICLEKYALALKLAQDVVSGMTMLPFQDREEIESFAKINLAECLFENGYDYEAEKIFHDVVKEGITNDPERETVIKLCLAAVSTSIHPQDSSLPVVDAALMQSVYFPSGKRLLRAIDQLHAVHKGSSHQELRSISIQETSSFLTCPESQTFIEGLVSQAGPSITSIESEISTIQNNDIVPTILELDVYYDKPNETCFVAREGHLDTQAGADYISTELVGLLGYRIYPFAGGQIVTAAGTTKPIGQISPYFEWRKSSKIRQRPFIVVRELPVDIILGIEFIREFHVYSVGKILLVMALSPLSKDEKKKLQDRADQNRKRRDAEEKLEEEQNRLKRIEKSLARQSQGSTSANGRRKPTGNQPSR